MSTEQMTKLKNQTSHDENQPIDEMVD